MKIIFLGEDSFSAVVLNSLVKANHEVLAVFCPIYDNHNFARLKRTSESLSIPFYRVEDINSHKVENLMKELNPDLISVNHFQKLLKKNILAIPKYGSINLHPSLLPNYRGLSPIQRPLIFGEKQTGITIHYIDEGIDSGDIILQKKIKITTDMYVSDLQSKLFKAYETIVVEAIVNLNGKKARKVSHKKINGSIYGKLKLDDCKIDINAGHKEALNLIRGVSRPYFGARIDKYRIWRAKLATKEQNKYIEQNYKENSVYLNEKIGDFMKFCDGCLMIESYDTIKLE